MLVSVAEAAQILGISKATIRSWIFQKKIQYVRMGRRTLFQPSDLEDLIRKNLVKPRDPQ